MSKWTKTSMVAALGTLMIAPIALRTWRRVGFRRRILRPRLVRTCVVRPGIWLVWTVWL